MSNYDEWLDDELARLRRKMDGLYERARTAEAENERLRAGVAKVEALREHARKTSTNGYTSVARQFAFIWGRLIEDALTPAPRVDEEP